MRLPRRLAHGEEVELVGHLEEFRSRLFVAGGAILATSIVAFVIHGRVIALLVAKLPPNHRHLLTLGVAEPFTTSLKVSIALGFALALPIVLWQLWSFVAPAMTPKTQRAIAGFTVFAAALLVAGGVFGYRVALPAALHFLTNYDNSIYNVQIRAADFISFAVLVLAACAAVFELPIVVLGLVRVGALTSKKLRHNRRIGYMIVACIGVALPGVDPVTTIVETIPLAILFESSIWMSVFFERRWFAALASPDPTLI
jgi:sec-independent protein translocase protein TatC